MSVQYRPDLGTIGLTPGYPPGREREYLTDTANSQQRANYYGAQQKSYGGGEGQSAYGTKIKEQSSPVSILSPPDSSQAVSENGARRTGGWSSASYQSESSSHSDASLEGQSNLEEADYYGQQHCQSEKSRASVGYRNSPSSVLRPMPRPGGGGGQGDEMLNYQQQQQAAQGVRHVPEELYARAQSNYTTRDPEVANALQFLESALLDDDEEEEVGEVSGSVSGGHNPVSEGSWADTLEELMAVESAATESEYGAAHSGSSTATVSGDGVGSECVVWMVTGW